MVRRDASGVTRVLLLRHVLLVVGGGCVLIGVGARHVVLFTRLRTDSSQSAKTWASFAWVIRVIMMVNSTGVAHRSSSMVDVGVRA